MSASPQHAQTAASEDGPHAEPLAAVPQPASVDPLGPARGMLLGGILGGLCWVALIAWVLS
jgi:hypothetical protein